MVLASPSSTATTTPAVASPQEKFLALKDLGDLARFVGLPIKKLTYLIFALTDAEKYTVFDIKKKSGGTRKISAPHVALKTLQRKIADVLVVMYDSKHSVHGYVTNRSIVSNAKAHVGKKHLLTFDLENFFPSINFGRVRGLFLNEPFNFPEVVATALARVCTADNSLPQGAPTSPILSNYICWGLDKGLKKFCYRSGCTYTRYADDIAISTNKELFPGRLAVVNHDPFEVVLSDELVRFVQSHGFQINHNKTRYASQVQSQVVTGLKVNRFPNVSRQYVRQLRSMLHAWDIYGLEKAEKEYRDKYCTKHRAPFLPPVSFRQVVHGKLTFLRSVKGAKDEIYQKLLGRFALLADLKRLTIAGFSKQINRAVWIIESEDLGDNFYQGTGFSLEGFGIVTCAHVLKAHSKIYKPHDYYQKYDINILFKDDVLDFAVIEAVGAPEEVVLVPDFTFQHNIGTQVRSVGFPAHAAHASISFEDGQITQKRRNQQANLWYRVNMNIVAGNSGGPVLNENMKVIGIVAYGSATLSSPGDTAINNGYVPINVVQGHVAKAL